MEDRPNEQISPLYEGVFLLMKEEDVGDIKRALEKNKVIIIKEKPPVKVQLAYQIKKQSQGFAFAFVFKTEGSIQELTSELNLQKTILRFLVARITREQEEEKSRRPVLKEKRERTRMRNERNKENGKIPEPVLTNEALQEKIEEILK